MIERICHDGMDLALILRHTSQREGIEFFTSQDATFQLGYMNRPTGHVIEPHLHKPVKREIVYTQEVLFVRKGRLRADFYDESERYVQSAILETGDVVLLVRGGHGFEILEASEIIEVKQGPFVGDRDKKRFESSATAAPRRANRK
jgi:hypothetical protein